MCVPVLACVRAIHLDIKQYLIICKILALFYVLVNSFDSLLWLNSNHFSRWLVSNASAIACERIRYLPL